LSAKSGIALFPSDAGAADTLIANAEAALKQAKHSPLPYLFYAPSMNGRVAEKLRLETKLRRALVNNEFLLFYQPKIELKSGEIVGMEALIRWRDPEVGLVPPGNFIPILEETELILQVGRWVIERAAAQYTEWLTLVGVPVPRIAVNVSALQLAQREFVSILEATLERYPEAKNGLDLELTESVLMDDLAGNIDKLRAAKELGFEVAIDDFGTGYSSLGYLSRLPLDALKVDRSFIDNMSDRDGDHLAGALDRPEGHRRGRRDRDSSPTAATAALRPNPRLLDGSPPTRRRHCENARQKARDPEAPKGLGSDGANESGLRINRERQPGAGTAGRRPARAAPAIPP
jgi:EAL domain-containing protein (putative c-di-GMP-specific phosphodiesterase class I)